MKILAIDLYKLLQELDPTLREGFIKILEKLDDILGETVRRSDFLELSKIVRETSLVLKNLAEAQRKTDKALKELSDKIKERAEAQRETDRASKELAETQRETDTALEELAEAQRKTEEELRVLGNKVEELAEAQRKTEEELKALTVKVKILTKEHEKTRRGLESLRKEVGSLSRSFSYAFKNEAYRNLPRVLKEKYGLKVKEKFLRTFFNGEEIKFFARAELNGKEVFIIGEAKNHLNGEKEVLAQLKKKEKAVKKVLGEVEILNLIVTHVATPRGQKVAQKEGLFGVQSFEW